MCHAWREPGRTHCEKRSEEQRERPEDAARQRGAPKGDAREGGTYGAGARRCAIYTITNRTTSSAKEQLREQQSPA
jgi:hypothetical protein